MQSFARQGVQVSGVRPGAGIPIQELVFGGSTVIPKEAGNPQGPGILHIGLRPGDTTGGIVFLHEAAELT